jgi:DNA-binding NtrC family response regulator
MALILVVDDEQDACSMLHRILSALGHQVMTFTEADDALVWLELNSPELAILDFKLQKLNGLELLKRIRSLTPTTQVVILTAYPSPETFIEALNLGAVKYLIKPIEIDYLETTVEEVLRAIP